MAAPASITYKTVSGRYVDASGAAMSGAVTFTPLATRIIDDTDGALIAVKPVRAILDGTGSFSVSLMAGDDGDVDPSGWSYEVREDLVSGSQKLVDTYSIALTTAMSSTVALTSLVPGSAATIDGGLVRPALVTAQYTSFAAVSNTTTETDVAKLTIPANATASGSILLFEAGGVLTNNSGGSISHVLKLKLGSTTIVTSASTAVATSANSLKWYLRAELLFATASTQRSTVHMLQSAQSSATWGTAGDVTVGFGTAAEAMSGATDFGFTVTPGTASASYSFLALWASLSRYA